MAHVEKKSSVDAHPVMSIPADAIPEAAALTVERMLAAVQVPLPGAGPVSLYEVIATSIGESYFEMVVRPRISALHVEFSRRLITASIENSILLNVSARLFVRRAKRSKSRPKKDKVGYVWVIRAETTACVTRLMSRVATMIWRINEGLKESDACQDFAEVSSALRIDLLGE